MSDTQTIDEVTMPNGFTFRRSREDPYKWVQVYPDPNHVVWTDTIEFKDDQ